MTSSTLLPRRVGADALPGALAEALAGGPAVAPLPPGAVERAQTDAMLDAGGPVPAGTVAVVATSGSTGVPKGVLLGAEAVRAAVAAAHARLGGPADWLTALPGHYVAGLMVQARALLAGTRAHPVAADLADLPAAATAAGPRRYLAVVPTQLTRALHDPARTAALAALDAVLVGGGPLEPATAAAARAAGVPVVAGYGMSETCGGCVYDGVPLDGVRVRLDADGRVSLAGPTLFSGYLGRPDLTAATLADGWLRTADRARWLDGRLHVLGRADDVVVSGGLNVDLAAVESALRGWPPLAGAEVAVLGVPDADWGTAVVAVAERWPADAEAALRGWLRERLPPWAAPRRLVARAPLPRTGSGKIDRPRLRAELADSTTGDR